MRSYIVFEHQLDRPGSANKGFQPGDLLTRSFGTRRQPGEQLFVERLTETAAAKIRLDPFTEITPQMPVRLIEPFAVSAADAQTAWGVAVVDPDGSRFDGPGVKVAVLDTGIASAHPAFAHVDLIEKDFSSSGNGDLQGHGSHCAGTIFGRDKGQRISVGPGITQACIGKVLANDGRGSSDMLFKALNWAADEGVNIVVSMSLGFDFPGMVDEHVKAGWPVPLTTSVALEAYRGNLRMFDAIMSMMKAREGLGSSPLVVAAAGNESRREQHADYRIAASLAAVEDVISVAALKKEGDTLSVADYSNVFAVLSGPGSDILSVNASG